MTRDADERRRALAARIQSEGLTIAYETALEVCQNKKAPAPARATAAMLIFRAGGLLAVKPDDGKIKEPHEMTADEIVDRIAELRSQQEARSARFDLGESVDEDDLEVERDDTEDHEDGSVFG